MVIASAQTTITMLKLKDVKGGRMKMILGAVFVLLGVALLLAYSPLPAGVIKNGFLAGLLSLFVSWRMLRAG